MRKKEVASVYLSGLAQGIALVAFPAAAAIFTSPHAFNFTSGQYGTLFIPLSLLSIVSSLSTTLLTEKWGIKTVLFLGLFSNLLSMSLFTSSYFLMKDEGFVYPFLLVSTGLLGLGFGLTVPSLNTLASWFFPKKVDAAVLYLNALLGLGTALSPVLVSFFVGFGFWWGLPFFLSIFFLLLFLFSIPLSFTSRPIEKKDVGYIHVSSIPARFWLYALFATLYGIVETMNGNWATLFMHKNLGANLLFSSYALTLFWSMVTFGRIFFALIEKWFKEKYTYQILPFVIAGAFFLLTHLQPSNTIEGILSFGLAGLGCSALLPLVISFAEKELVSMEAAVSGGVLAFYLFGYGIAAFGAGYLQESIHIQLPIIYGYAVWIAVFLGFISFIINLKQK